MELSWQSRSFSGGVMCRHTKGEGGKKTVSKTISKIPLDNHLRLFKSLKIPGQDPKVLFRKLVVGAGRAREGTFPLLEASGRVGVGFFPFPVSPEG